MPFPSAATPFLVSLTFHFGSVVLSLPGYSATYPTRPESAVAAVACRDTNDETRVERVCASAPGGEKRLMMRSGELGVEPAGTAAAVARVPLPAAPLPTLGLRWVQRSGGADSGTYAIPSNAGHAAPGGLPRMWLSLQGQ